MNKSFYLIFIIVVIGVGYYFGFGRNQKDKTIIDISPSPSVSVTVTPTTTLNNEVSLIKEFTVIATPFTFSLAEIKVKKGDKVRIIFRNDKGMHDWVVDEFNSRTKVLQTGQSETIEFVADKVGTFEYYCSVGSHRSMGMTGNLVVE